MSITQALNTAAAGLRATQAGLSLVASNVANAQTAGYVRKSLVLTTTTSNSMANGVAVSGVNRELDTYLQRQLRVENAGGAYANLRADFYAMLQQIYGQPGSSNSLETVFGNFTSAVQSLVTSPDSAAARSMVLNNAQVLTQALNGATASIQALRADAEGGLADAAAAANAAMQKIADLNVQLSGRDISNTSDAALADQRDYYIDQLSELMDIQVVQGESGQLNVFTNSGVQLVGTTAAKLTFNAQGTVNATTRWSADPSESTLGTLTLVSASGNTLDLIATNSIRSGKIAAYIDMRDNVLVEAQNQLDALASTMARALSDVNVEGSAVTAGPQDGYDVDTAGLLNGDRINLTYTDVLTGTQHRVSIVRVDDPSVLPLGNGATADPGDEVIGVDFSGGLASVAAQLNAYFGGSLDFSVQGASTLRVLDDGGANTTNVDGLSVTQTATALAGGDPAIALFTDGYTPYTGAFGANGSQSVGFAGRISVNPALLADPSKLVGYDASTSIGDPTRPSLIYDRLTSASYDYSGTVGLGSAAAPFNSSLPGYLRQVLSTQGAAASNAQSLADGQSVVVNALKERVQQASGVNIDEEMSNLIALQTAYGANARVLTAVRDILDLLLNM